MTVYAQWEANKYTITFEAQDGTPEIQTKQVSYGQEVGELPTATMTGYTFVGWENRTPGFEGYLLRPETRYNVLRDATYYAMWIPSTFTATWDAQGGIADEETRDVQYGEEIGELPNATRDGYHLLGWFTEAIGGIQVNNETKVLENVTYYARWELNGTINLTFRDNIPVSITYNSNFDEEDD